MMASNSPNPKRQITVVGFGVSGLTSARLLQQHGHKVRIIADRPPMETTSAVAAALWFPYRSGPAAAVNRWSRESHAAFSLLAENPATGVSMVDFLEMVGDETKPWWLDAIPAGAWRKAKPSEVLVPGKFGYVMRVPMVETQVYLPWLLHQFEADGGEWSLQGVGNLGELLLSNDIVVNCTGLGARSLCQDERMAAIRGQLIKVDVLPGLPYVSADSMHGAESFEATYIFPRRDCIVLGGTAVLGNESLDWDSELGDRLMARCKTLVPALEDAVVQSTVVGLRPWRDEIRLETEGRIIHNYGHGGAGFTVSWGCAHEVLRLVEALKVP